MGLPENFFRKERSSKFTSSSNSGSSKSSRAWYLLSAASFANLFQGHTARQSSQPYIRFPIFGLKCSGTGLLLSIVRYEMQRRASSLYGFGNAFVGHTSRQEVHVPQLLISMLSSSILSVVNIDPIKNQLPSSLLTKFVCLPCQPNPAA